MNRVSVIIPVYNVEKYLKRCFDSIINQSLKEIEIICIDDASTDGSLKIAKYYESVDNRVHVLEQAKNKGVSASRNLALKQAVGEYILFLDADDYLEHEALEHLYQYASLYETEICFFKPNLIASQGVDISRVPSGIINSYPGVFTGKELMEKFVNEKEFFYYPWMALFRHSFLKENSISFKRLKIGEGGEFILHSMLLAKKVVVNDGKYYNYYIHSESVIRSNQEKNRVLLGQITQYCSVLKYAADYQNETGVRTFLEYQYQKMIGGIRNLTEEEVRDISNELEGASAKHIFKLLLGSNERKSFNLTEEQLKTVKHKNKAIIYGAGNTVLDVLKMLNNYSIVLQAIAVSEKCNNPDVLYGHCVYAIDELREYAKDCVVIIAVKMKYHEEIIQKIKSLGFSSFVCINIDI